MPACFSEQGGSHRRGGASGTANKRRNHHGSLNEKQLTERFRAELEKLAKEYPLVPHTDAGRTFSMVRRMNAEKKIGIPINLRTGFAISTTNGKAANRMTEDEWEEFYDDLSEHSSMSIRTYTGTSVLTQCKRQRYKGRLSLGDRAYGNALPYTGCAPSPEPPIDRVSVAIFLGDVAPWRPSAQPPQNAIDDVAISVHSVASPNVCRSLQPSTLAESRKINSRRGIPSCRAIAGAKLKSSLLVAIVSAAASRLPNLRWAG